VVATVQNLRPQFGVFGLRDAETGWALLSGSTYVGVDVRWFLRNRNCWSA
jgi:hypothetical protein